MNANAKRSHGKTPSATQTETQTASPGETQRRRDPRAICTASARPHAVHECGINSQIVKTGSNGTDAAQDARFGQSPLAPIDYSACRNANCSQQSSLSLCNQWDASLHNGYYPPASCRVIRFGREIVRPLERLAGWLARRTGGHQAAGRGARWSLSVCLPSHPPGVSLVFLPCVKGTLG